ncbi:hypothetical protein PsorP6_015888 [Peronosclerospora sorghi]|uniref:Uncharacterized protein n=1 Tax=Peronosclerospora sorghi TaxID=230839 RepID=A0ACC0WNY8_9STRA|nr:hypothetical protein PsorP6_015888 [Peronosclerospora sorghi]
MTKTRSGKHTLKADLAIEAVFEDLSLNHKVLSDLENYVSEECVIATNTSALPIADIASACKRPENVIGMHYFSPVPNMPLLEIIRHAGTSDDTSAKAVDLGLRQGKTAIVVKDVPGSYVNRCLGSYIAETLALPPKGKKNKKTVNADAMNLVKKFQKNDLKLSDEDTVIRLISRFVNEAVLCVQDDIIASPTEGDIGAVFVIGFPPFIGGPFRYVDKNWQHSNYGDDAALRRQYCE